MGRPKKVQKPSKYDLLEDGWRDSVASMSDEEIGLEMGKAWANIHALRAARKLDQDLDELTTRKKMAEEPYKLGEKTNIQKSAFMVEILKGRGRVLPGVEDFLKAEKD